MCIDIINIDQFGISSLSSTFWKVLSKTGAHYLSDRIGLIVLLGRTGTDGGD